MDLPREWTRADFDTYVEREHERVELKSGAGQRPLQQALVAFSNTTGGVVLVGGDDGRRLLGRRRDQSTDDAIHAAARDGHDVGTYDIREIAVDGVPLVAVVVRRRVEGFAQTSDGRVLVRRGGHNVALVGSDLQHFLSTRRLVRFERTDAGVRLGAVDPSAARRLAAAHGWDELAEPRLLERGLATSSGTLTIAGALLLTDPSETLGSRKLVVDVRGYEDDVHADYVRREEITGPIDEQVRQASRLVSRDLGVDMVITGTERQELPRLPPQAVREVVANAVAHRSYEVATASVTIEVRPGRLVVASPGPLPEPVTVATLREAQSPRNPVVIDVLRKLGLSEDSGRGIDLIEDSLRDDFLPDPLFEDDGSQVRVTMRTGRAITVQERAWLAQHQRDHVISDDEAVLLVQAARQGSVTNATARTVVGKDSTEVRAMLRRLRDRGLLRHEGQRGGSVYRLGDLVPRRPDDDVVLEAADRAALGNTDVRELLGVDAVAARRILNRLVAAGQLRRTGERRGTKYVLVRSSE